MIKGFTEWGKQEEQGLLDSEVRRYISTLESSMPEECRNMIDWVKSKEGPFRKVNTMIVLHFMPNVTTRGQTYEIKATTTNMLHGDKRMNINNVVPRVVLQASAVQAPIRRLGGRVWSTLQKAGLKNIEVEFRKPMKVYYEPSGFRPRLLAIYEDSSGWRIFPETLAECAQASGVTLSEQDAKALLME